MKNTKTLLRVVVLGSAALMLQACGSSPSKSSGSEEFQFTDSGTYSQDSGVAADDRISHSIGNPAIVAIWQRAEEARLTGDTEGAIAQLERAIRIDPTDPVIWSRMAELRLDQGNHIAAENVAMKSNQLNNGEDTVLAYRNWLIIGKARKAEGNLKGAEEAQRQAQAFKP
ncbi:tetratricopeptide repeat domain protein [gamma proteobacterium HTCC5015]|nr:tetratricopeptide repeat domain protein [gamma proteobacterium HTCC5015]